MSGQDRAAFPCVHAQNARAPKYATHSSFFSNDSCVCWPHVCIIVGALATAALIALGGNYCPETTEPLAAGHGRIYIFRRMWVARRFFSACRRCLPDMNGIVLTKSRREIKCSLLKFWRLVANGIGNEEFDQGLMSQ